MELKVSCDCGQKFKFDVEPVNGQMPFTVMCPACNRDATDKANALLAQSSQPNLAESALVMAPPNAPMPSAPGPICPPPPSAAAPAKLRINVPAHAAPPADSAGTPQTIAPALGSGAVVGRPRLGMTPLATPVVPGQQSSFAKGSLGAVIGAAVGSLLYFIIYKTTGPIPFLRYFLALGVGGLTGWLANLLGKGEGSKELGGLAAVFTIIGIVGAQYLLEMAEFRQEISQDDSSQFLADGGYAMSLKMAKEVVKAIPTGSDTEIKMYIAKQQAGEGEAPRLESVSNDAVKQFRDTDLAEYTDLASGKLTREQYWAKIKFDPKAAQKSRADLDKTISGLALLFAVLRGGIISMVVGAGLAFRLAANA